MHHAHALDNAAEGGVATVEVGRGRVGEEVLGTFRVRADGGHAQDALGDVVEGRQFRADAVVEAAVAVAAGAAVLDDEVGYDAMKDLAVIEAAADQLHEIGHRAGRFLGP